MASNKTEVPAVNQAGQATAVTNLVSLEAQTQRLKIGKETQDDDDGVFLEEAIKLAAAEKKELKAEEKASILLFP